MAEQKAVGTDTDVAVRSRVAGLVNSAASPQTVMLLEILKSVGNPVTEALFWLRCTFVSVCEQQAEACQGLCLHRALGMLLSPTSEEAGNWQARWWSAQQIPSEPWAAA